MKNKNIIIGAVISIAVLSGAYLLINKSRDNTTQDNNKIEENLPYEEKENNKELLFLQEIIGVKANEVELIGSPIGLEGEFVAPRESILKGVDYFLKDTKNSKMEDIHIDIDDGYIYLTTTYKVNKFIKTPIEVKVQPSLDIDQNLVLKVYDFKFLDLKIADWIVNIGVEGFIKDWFPDDKDIKVTFEEGKVVIDKSNFESLILNNIYIDKNGLIVDMIINLEKVI